MSTAAAAATADDLPTGTVTFLFTDIEGSTRLLETRPEAMHPALARHDALARGAIEGHGGRVFKTIGDAFCAAFATAPDAVAAALALQRALLRAADPPMPFRVRIALHSGAAEARDNDYFGASLSRAARLRDAAHGGQTLLTLATVELARDALPNGADLKDLGAHRLRDVQRPEHVFQLVHPDLPPDDFPPLRTLDNLPNNLPRQLTSFIGREKELADVRRLLETACLLTLTGAGGAGKTRLALQAGADALDTFPDGVWLVELAALGGPALVPQAVAGALSVREDMTGSRPLVQTLMDHLRPRRLLLVLDNCEHLVAACAQLAETLLQGCSDLRILATSREPLNIGGEVTYRVPSLPSPPPPPALARGGGGGKGAEPPPSAEALTQYDAVRLFIERARAAQPAFAITDANAPAVAQICHRLDGIPLAIELAAARVKVLSPEQIAERLQDRFRLLTAAGGGRRTALPRQQTLQALIDWSYDLLSEAEKALLRRASVFAGGWTLSAAEAVCADGANLVDAWDVLDLLTGLVDKSLVAVEEPTPPSANENAGPVCLETRYRLSETVRQYGLARLREAGEEADVCARHRAWYSRLVQEAQLEGAGQVVWLQRLESEHDNLRAALDECAHAPDGALDGLRLAGSLGKFWELRSYLSEGREQLAFALSRPDPDAHAATPERARALLSAGRLAWCQGGYPSARAFFEDGLAICQALGDKRGVAYALNGLGNTAQYNGDPQTARACYDRALALRRELGDTAAVAVLLFNLGVVTTDAGDYEAAARYFNESLPLADATGDSWVTGVLRWGMGNLAIRQNDLGRARALLDEALATALRLGTTWCAPYALEGFGALAAAEKQFARAARLLAAAEALRESLGMSLPPSERERREPSVRAARSALGEAAFADAWAEGRALTLDEAVRQAREGSAD